MLKVSALVLNQLACMMEYSFISCHKMVTVSGLPLKLDLLMCAFLFYQIKNLLLYMSHLKCSLNKSRRLDKIRIELTYVTFLGQLMRQYTHGYTDDG